ncbi:hypothetical protein M758_2G220300 [Ceratodon purpureus]|nr:hypothetical protein M758_2G220300 [Ceratodon purpureus]
MLMCFLYREIGNGASDSFFMRLDKQADLVCDQVKSIQGLKDGYNIVGLSQGNVVARAVIEFCNGGPPVHNFVSLGGPHAGTASIPGCTLMSLCKLANALIRLGVYSPFVQNHLAPSGYVKIPTDLDAYYKGSLFLPKLNNEIAIYRNETYKKRLESLNHLVLIMTDLYKEDWIGLRALDEGGRVTYIAFPGDHLSINDLEVRDFIIPYLKSSPTDEVRVLSS